MALHCRMERELVLSAAAAMTHPVLTHPRRFLDGQTSRAANKREASVAATPSPLAPRSQTSPVRLDTTRQAVSHGPCTSLQPAVCIGSTAHTRVFRGTPRHGPRNGVTRKVRSSVVLDEDDSPQPDDRRPGWRPSDAMDERKAHAAEVTHGSYVDGAGS